MPSNQEETIKITPSARYIKQNMNKAIRGDVVRGLVELITNSDDSYKRIEQNEGKPSGGIVIEVERGQKSSVIKVRDRAEGMTLREVKSKIATMGELTSGFEVGKTIRGLHGRGAKDVADLGEVTFETIKNDEYTKFTFNSDATGKISSEKASETLRDKLKIKKNGTIVTIVTQQGIKMPIHENLLSKLSNYYSLRDINANPKRKILLVDSNQNRSDHIHYNYPEGGEIVFNELVSIPHYPSVTANIIIRKHKKAFKKQLQSSPYRDGILVKSIGAIHDCQYFGLDSEPLAWRFSGEVNCGYIDTLIDDYDKAERANSRTLENSVRILNPDRDGLISDHPFTKALFDECRKVLIHLIEEIKENETEDAHNVINASLLRKLDELSKEVSTEFEKDIKELDVEAVYDTGDYSKNLPRGLHIIPGGNHEMKKGEKKTFTVVLVDYDDDFSLPLKVSSSSNSIRVNKNYCSFERDKNDSSTARTRFQIEAKDNGEVANIKVEYKSIIRFFQIRVVEVEDLFEKRDGLFFLKEKYYIVYGKTKKITVYLKTPNQYNEKRIRLISSKPLEISVLKGGQTTFHKTSQDNLYKAEFLLEGKSKQATALVTAMTDGFESATANITVSEREHSGVNFEFEPTEDNFGPVRYKWDLIKPSKLQIGAKHESIRRYLGKLKDGVYPGINSPLYHTVLAEVIAEALAFNLLEKKFNREGEGQKLDYTSTDYYYHEYFSKYLSIAHRNLVKESSVDVFLKEQK